MLIYMSTGLGMFDNMQVLECKQTRESSSRGRCLETKPGLHDNIESASTKKHIYNLYKKCLRPVLRAKVVRGRARRWFALGQQRISLYILSCRRSLSLSLQVDKKEKSFKFSLGAEVQRATPRLRAVHLPPTWMYIWPDWFASPITLAPKQQSRSLWCVWLRNVKT